jgi:hypothetical protein
VLAKPAEALDCIRRVLLKVFGRTRGKFQSVGHERIGREQIGSFVAYSLPFIEKTR